jgi:hypothetical protein
MLTQTQGPQLDESPAPVRNVVGPRRNDDEDMLDLDPAVDFDFLKVHQRRAGSFPSSLRLAMWNCRGIKSKYHQIWDLFLDNDVDVVILNETFRLPGSVWPKNLPPCIGEATGPPIIHEGHRVPNGVAVLVNPKSITAKGKIRKVELLEVENLTGTKVVVKVNNLIIFAVYTPTSMGPELLTRYAQEAKVYSQDNASVVFTGDLNTLPSVIDVENVTHSESVRFRTLNSSLGSRFIRADTGPNATRPANRADSIRPGGNILDHFFGSEVDFREGNCLIDFPQVSDHQPIIAVVSPRVRRPDCSVKYRRIRVEHLRDEGMRMAYIDSIAVAMIEFQASAPGILGGVNRHSPTLEKQQAVDGIEKKFVSSILESASRTLGEKIMPVVPQASTRREPTGEYLDLQRRLRSNMQLLRVLGDFPAEDPEVQSLLASCDSIRTQMSNSEVNASNASYREWTLDFGKMNVSQRAKVMNRILRRKSAAGASLSTTATALASYRDFFKNQFVNTHIDPEPFSPSVGAIDDEVVVRKALEIFTDELVFGSIIRSPAGKAPGITGLSADILHPVVHLIAPKLTSLFCLYFFLDMVPSSWKRALVCPVPKKGDLTIISNYRPVSLTEVTRKIFEMGLLESLKGSVTLSREQGGFREGRSTLDQIQALDATLQLIKSRGQSAHVAFLDIKAAYDSVPRPVLWTQCEEVGVDSLVISCLQTLFDHNSAMLAISQKRSSPFGLPAGVLQGSVLSPILYSIYLDPLVARLSEDGPSISLPHSGGKINCFLYADDIALVATSASGLKKLLQVASADSFVRGYRFSPTKCIVVAPGKSVQRIYGNALVRQRSFCYLGVDMSNTGIKACQHVDRRIAKAEKMAVMLAQVGARFRGFSAKVNVTLYQVFIRPGLEYGLPLFCTHGAAMKALNLCQKRILCRTFLGVDSKARNVVIQGMTNCPPFEIRASILRSARIRRLVAVIDEVGWENHALAYVLRCTQVEPFIDRSEADRTKSQILEDYHLHLDETIARVFDGCLERVTLRWLLNMPLSPGIMRTVLLWILGRWNCFELHRCRHCGAQFQSQGHVIDCSSLVETLGGVQGLFGLNQSPQGNPRWIVEFYLAEIRHSPLESIPSFVAVLESQIRNSIHLVFGDSYI